MVLGIVVANPNADVSKKGDSAEFLRDRLSCCPVCGGF